MISVTMMSVPSSVQVQRLILVAIGDEYAAELKVLCKQLGFHSRSGDLDTRLRELRPRLSPHTISLFREIQR